MNFSQRHAKIECANMINTKVLDVKVKHSAQVTAQVKRINAELLADLKMSLRLTMQALDINSKAINDLRERGAAWYRIAYVQEENNKLTGMSYELRKQIKALES